ncbi:hypothetical protein AUI51_03690 [archaeon 13_1_40CM_2_52_4]|nr:MAG: hypothetical protein AUI51_03690 [archaeon 13_1_40CM_2_52_4]
MFSYLTKVKNKTISFFHVRTFASLQLVVLALLSLVVFNPSPSSARPDAQAPYSTITVGDWWSYSTTNYASGLTLTGSMTETIAGSATILVNGISTDSYRLVVTGTGTISGLGVTGTFTESGSLYLRKSDMGAINGTATIVETAGIVVTVIVSGHNTIPVAPYKFPLAIGNSWSTSYTDNTTITQYTSVNPTPVVTNNVTQVTRSYSVVSSSIMTVGAGSFEGYDVHSTDSSGSTDDYYSPQVENSLKMLSYDSKGSLTASQSLTAFNAWPYGWSIPTTINNSNYHIQIESDATIANGAKNSTSITFQVTGPDSVSGRANVTIPIVLNSTSIKVFVDTNSIIPTVTKNSTDFFVYFTFGLSTHTITLQYAPPPTAGLPLTTILLILGAVAAIIIVTAITLLLRSKKKPPPTQVASGPSQPPPSEEPPSQPPSPLPQTP